MVPSLVCVPNLLRTRDQNVPAQIERFGSVPRTGLGSSERGRGRKVAKRQQNIGAVWVERCCGAVLCLEASPQGRPAGGLGSPAYRASPQRLRIPATP